jgi:hypothetical protein
MTRVRPQRQRKKTQLLTENESEKQGMNFIHPAAL